MVKKIKTELTYLKYESDWNRLDINFGSVIFKMSKDKIYLDETPYACNETLSEIFNLKLDDAGYLFFSVNSYKKKVIEYRLDCNTVAGAAELARCLISVHSGAMARNAAYDDIDIVIKENNYYAAIGTRHLKLFLLFDNPYRHDFTERFPEPSKEFDFTTVDIDKNMIQVNCVGPDLNNEQSGLVDYKYEWQLNLPKELELHCQLLLKTTFSLMSKIQ